MFFSRAKSSHSLTQLRSNGFEHCSGPSMTEVGVSSRFGNTSSTTRGRASHNAVGEDTGCVLNAKSRETKSYCSSSASCRHPLERLQAAARLTHCDPLMLFVLHAPSCLGREPMEQIAIAALDTWSSTSDHATADFKVVFDERAAQNSCKSITWRSWARTRLFPEVRPQQDPTRRPRRP